MYRELDSESEEQWTNIIEPHDHYFDLKLGELWQYRDLIYIFVHRDFVAQYKQTVLGPVWHLAHPLLTTLVFTIIFGRIARISTDGLPPFLFYMAGITIWNYFSAVLLNNSDTFVRNAGIFEKVYFPRIAVPVAALISNLIAFGIQYLLFICVAGYFYLRGADISPNLWVLATPLLLLMMAMFALGLGAIVSALTTRYRDLAILVTFGTQLLMFASPIIYPLSTLPDKWLFWASLNPIAPIIELFRYAYLGVGTVSVSHVAYSTTVILIVLYLGISLFNRVERTFVDTV